MSIPRTFSSAAILSIRGASALTPASTIRSCRRRDGHGVADENVRPSRQFGELPQEILVVGGELVFELPVLGLGIVGAQHDDHDVGIVLEGILEGPLVLVGLVAVLQEGGAADAEAADLPFCAQHLAELVG